MIFAPMTQEDTERCFIALTHEVERLRTAKGRNFDPEALVHAKALRDQFAGLAFPPHPRPDCYPIYCEADTACARHTTESTIDPLMFSPESEDRS